jgi:hypothetical protein
MTSSFRMIFCLRKYIRAAAEDAKKRKICPPWSKIFMILFFVALF